MYASIPLVTTLKLIKRSNLSAIAWQASHDIDNEVKSKHLMHDT